MRLIFVCSGNTCRSPLALAAWRAAVKSGEAPSDIQASSAGLIASDGAPANAQSTPLAASWGQDLSSHRAKTLSENAAREADYLVAMTSDQTKLLREYFGIAESKVLLLGKFDALAKDEITHDVLDPFGCSREAYETCAGQIQRAVKGLAHALQRGEL